MFAVNEIESRELIGRMDAEDDFVLVDVRTLGEMFQGVLPSAMATPLNQLPAVVEELPRDKDVIIYCRTGARSAQACAYLMSMGLQSVFNLRGGIFDYARQGGKIVAPDTAMFESANAAMQYRASA